MSDTPIRPQPATLHSPELRAYAQAALPHKILVAPSGHLWCLNARGNVLLVKLPMMTFWHPPELVPDAAKPRDVCAEILLWDDRRAPWHIFETLHGMEALLLALQTAGRRRAGRPRNGSSVGGGVYAAAGGKITRHVPRRFATQSAA
jgi:hypothetical protein